MFNIAGNGAGGYNLNNSLRFRASASAYLSRTVGSTTNRQIFTLSAWVKRGTLGARQIIFAAANPVINTTSQQEFQIAFLAADTIEIVGGVSGVSLDFDVITTQVFRDPSAWYHIVLAVDTTQATAANRIKFYVNGSQVTTFGTATYPAQNYNTSVNLINFSNRFGSSGTNYFDGYNTEVNFVDGTALTPSSFGSTDATTGQWLPKKYTGTYGTNGFYLPFNNSNATGFSSYYGSFNGSNQYLTFTGNTGLQFGTGDFTVEYWMYQTSTPSQVTVLDLRGSPTAAPCTFGMFNTSIIYYNGTSNVQTTGFTPTANTWAHVAFSRASGVIKVFVNGVQYYSGAETTNFNTGTGTVYVGRGSDAAGYYMAGYVSNLRVVKGTALYTANFTPPTSALTAVSGTQLLMLQNATFVDNSSNAFAITNNNSTTSVSGTVGSYAQINRDTSGNNNHWAMSNINYTASGTTYDSMTDVPTNTSATVANYCTINPLKNTASITSGNLDMAGPTTGGNYSAFCTQATTSTLIYYEVTIKNYNTGTIGFAGFGKTEVTLATSIIGTTGTFGFVPSNSTWYSYKDATSTALTGLTGLAIGDIIMVAFNPSTGNAWVGKNGTWFNSGVPNTGTNPTLTGLTTGVEWNPLLNVYRDTGNYIEFSANFGQRPFTYTPPTGFVRLNTYNLPTPTILKSNKVFDATLYTGTGSTLSVTNAGAFKPDLVWIKSRSGAFSHNINDSNRGVLKQLQSDNTSAESNLNGAVSAYNTNGFSVTNGSSGIAEVSNSASTYVAWQWQGGQGSNVSNTSGSITSTVSANTSAGVSIVTYTGTGANATVGHGLGVAPKMIFVKSRSNANGWIVWHTSLTSGAYFLDLQGTSAQTLGTDVFQSTIPSSTVVTLGTNLNVNRSGGTQLIYAWAEIAGFSKFGSYTGNGSADGTFIYLGFKPKFWLIKRTDAAGAYWILKDSSNSTYNVTTEHIYPNSSQVADSFAGHYVDFLSNGVKIRAGSNTDSNGSGATYIYAAFAESPFKYANAK